MIRQLKKAYRAAPIATVVLAISLVLALGFTTKLVVDVFDGPNRKAEQIEEWMTPRFISRNWKVPPEVMREIIGIEKQDSRPENLRQIADIRGITVEQLIEELERDIEAFKEARKQDRDRK